MEIRVVQEYEHSVLHFVDIVTVIKAKNKDLWIVYTVDPEEAVVFNSFEEAVKDAVRKFTKSKVKQIRVYRGYVTLIYENGSIDTYDNYI